MKSNNIFNRIKIIFILLILLQFSASVFAQENNEYFNQDTIITYARKMMETARYCALITLDKTGQPTARTMEPFIPKDDMVVWFGTNLNSNKIKEIMVDSRVTLYYQSPSEVGYVLIKGHAYLENDTELKKKYWKNEWSRFYSDDKSNYLLIKVIPDKLELIDYQHGIIGDSETWTAPFVKFN